MTLNGWKSWLKRMIYGKYGKYSAMITKICRVTVRMLSLVHNAFVAETKKGRYPGRGSGLLCLCC